MAVDVMSPLFLASSFMLHVIQSEKKGYLLWSYSLEVQILILFITKNNQV